MSTNTVHHDWLALIEISGPFLAVPVLTEVFPQGLEELDGSKRKRLRQAYEEWREALETDDPQFTELHAEWIDEVLARGLELDENRKGDVLKRADWCAANLKAALPEHGVTLSPDLAVVDEQRSNKPLMLIQTYGNDVDLDATLKLNGWAATPADRMVQLCRSTGCRLGLVTNGERWMLVDAPIGAVTTFASWYARIWSQEPITLQAFVHLLGIRRFFVDESEQLPALLDRSLKYQDEVTDALGEQVRRAVEVLIQALDKADQDRDRELLQDVKEPELYEAALTVMMRLVFLLSAEERGLLLLGDERYEANYALSTLRMQLRKESEEILERRWDAWSRLLAIFRAVFGGIEHENLRLPALGGSLFDPDRFPFLEGRAKGSNWRTDTAKPLPIDNRTVLLLLEAIQQFQGRTLSYRALDVEQIGYVYEGLLERTVKRTAEVTLELDGTKNAKAPWVKLAELESARLDGAERLAELLQERSGSSASRVRNDLAKPVDDTLADRLLAACHGDTSLRNRIKPFAHLVRTDPWGYPLIYPAGAFIVTTGSDRRETGTHYTPKSLTEAIVTETLTPIAYVGPAEGIPREQWVLKSPAELLDLKVCDPAMGSGAFLVQACRWLADRLVEAWSLAEGSGKTVSVDGEVLDAPGTKEPLPRDTEARTLIARRLIAERCLYGVDLNPLAVELAKLSIWLVTLAKGRPFGFLNHNLRCGDSLLGIHRLDQLTELSMAPTGKGQQRLFGQNIKRAVREAIELRQTLRMMPIRDIRDVEAMARLDADARQKLEVPEHIADAFIGQVFASGGNGTALEGALASLTLQAGQAINGDREALASMRLRAIAGLSVDLLTGKHARRPFHWPLEFPEVFRREAPGFDAVIGNPPFLGGKRISSAYGDSYLSHLQQVWPFATKNVDLCGYFHLLAASVLTRTSGHYGFISTEKVLVGDSKTHCLNVIENEFGLFTNVLDRQKWPGSASVSIALIFFRKQAVRRDQVFIVHDPARLLDNWNKSFVGCAVQGMGFVLQAGEESCLEENTIRDVIRPFLTASDLNSTPLGSPSRSIIFFADMELDEAEKYSDAISLVRERVKPYRDTVKRKAHKERWWRYGDWRPGLYSALKGREEALAVGLTSKYFAFLFVPARYVFDQTTVVIPGAGLSEFSVLTSSFHTAWALAYGNDMGETPRYIATRCFETYPFPDASDSLEIIGNHFYAQRKAVMIARGEGVTKTYNRIHDPDEIDGDIVELRRLQSEIDLTVARAYGWHDLCLGHGFHEVPNLPESDRVRFTIDESSRVEVLRRLIELNRARYEEEIARGLHGAKIAGSTTRAQRKKRAGDAASSQPSFDFDASPTNGSSYLKAAEARHQYQTDSAQSVVEYLKSHSGWRAKADILAATGLTNGQWNAVIPDLHANGEVERQGEKRGARYRVATEGAKE